MILSLTKNKEKYKLTICKENGKEENFEYVTFINMLYEEKQEIKIKYDDNITEEEKNQINKMIKEINEIIEKERIV